LHQGTFLLSDKGFQPVGHGIAVTFMIFSQTYKYYQTSDVCVLLILKIASDLAKVIETAF